MSGGTKSDAHLDPWCLVALGNDSTVLFGYAHRHPETGGLAWLCSSEVQRISRLGRSVTTQSGRRYSLGRRFDAIDVGGEGEEARLAFHLLIGPDFEDLDTLVGVDRRWLMARKAARHLGIEPPIRTDAATRAFFADSGEVYIATRERAGRVTS